MASIKLIKSKAFNLIELMIVIVILAIAISVAVVKYANYIRRAEISAAYSSAKAVEAAIIRTIHNKDAPLSDTDIAAFNVESVKTKNSKYFASINVVSAAINQQITGLPDVVLAEITKSVPASDIVAYASYDLTNTCRIIADKPAQWFNIIYYLSQEISSTVIGVGAKLDCMPATYQTILCPDGSYSSNQKTCISCTPLTGATIPCTDTEDAKCAPGSTKFGNECRCNSGTYLNGNVCQACTALTGAVISCTNTADARCAPGSTKFGNECRCNSGTYLNSNVCQACTALTGAIIPCTTTSDTRCVSGATRNGTVCSCGANQYFDGSECHNCSVIPNCVACSSPTSCTNCNSGFHPNTNGTACIQNCIATQYQDANGACQSCDSSCATCFGSGSNQCLSCNSGSLTNGTCSIACPPGSVTGGRGRNTNVPNCSCPDNSYYWNGSSCIPCPFYSVDSLASGYSYGPTTPVGSCKCVDSQAIWSNTFQMCLFPCQNYDYGRYRCHSVGVRPDSGYFCARCSGNVCTSYTWGQNLTIDRSHCALCPPNSSC